ncbi:hypothetical protein BFL36_05485 [Clavibacter michiganensis]|uniref:Uncharacterized protein n=1 Tax=Clavibacter michiganensis TaxID=28447 RepID=A0A251YLM3_9MICO|nr:hypothetical protein BFL36_05485 [Clavibacter michiganensis]
MIADPLNTPGSNATVSARSAKPVARRAVTGPGRSCTWITTVPNAARPASPVASRTSYCTRTSPGTASAVAATARVARSADGVTVTPAGRLAPSAPRMEATVSGVPGNGLPAWSFASTSIVVEDPRVTVPSSVAGWASGRVDGTTRRSTRPARPVCVASRTPTAKDAATPVSTPSSAEIRRVPPSTDARKPSPTAPSIA